MKKKHKTNILSYLFCKELKKYLQKNRIKIELNYLRSLFAKGLIYFLLTNYLKKIKNSWKI